MYETLLSEAVLLCVSSVSRTLHRQCVRRSWTERLCNYQRRSGVTDVWKQLVEADVFYELFDTVIILWSFYRAMLRRARYCYGKLSVRLSVTLRYRDHIGWNSSKITSRLVRLGCSLTADSNITDLLQVDTPGISANKSSNNSEMWHDTKVTIDRRTNRKSYTHFWLVPKSTTLDDLEGSLCTLFQNTCAIVLFIYF